MEKSSAWQWYQENKISAKQYSTARQGTENGFKAIFPNQKQESQVVLKTFHLDCAKQYLTARQGTENGFKAIFPKEKRKSQVVMKTFQLDLFSSQTY